MTSDMTKIPSGDGGEFGVYPSKPSTGSGPGMVMIQEILGITPWLKEIADDFAGQGYVVIVPDFSKVTWQRVFSTVRNWITKRPSTTSIAVSEPLKPSPNAMAK